MTKDEALAFDLALGALKEDRAWLESDAPIEIWEKNNEAITAIKQARALYKMAENARELGLDYEPVAPVQEDWGPGPHECHSLTASVQEPVAWRYRGILHDFDPSDWSEGPVTPFYTTPPAAQRQWVGLTDEEVYPLANEHLHYQMEGYEVSGIYNLAQAIETKLKEKNT